MTNSLLLKFLLSSVVVFVASPCFGHVWLFPTPHRGSLRSPSRSLYTTPLLLQHVLLYSSIYSGRPEGAEPHSFIPSHHPLAFLVEAPLCMLVWLILAFPAAFFELDSWCNCSLNDHNDKIVVPQHFLM